MNSAPASMLARRSASFRTVPAPTIAPATAFISRITSSAAAVRKRDFQHAQAPRDQRFSNWAGIGRILDHQNGDHGRGPHDRFNGVHRLCSLAKAAAAPNKPGWGWVMSLTGMAAIMRFKTALGAEAVGKTRSEQTVLDPQAQARPQ